jgi:hypothetical protein
MIIPYCPSSFSKELWQEEESRPDGKWKQYSCFVSTMLVFTGKKHKVVECMLRKYEDMSFQNCIKSDEKFGGALCIRDAFEICFADSELSNVALSPASGIETFKNDADEASKAILSLNWTLARPCRAVWMGSLATSARWSEAALLPSQIASGDAERKVPWTVLRGIISLNSLKKASFEKTNCFSGKKLACSHYSKNLSILSPFKTRSYGTAIEDVSCAPTIIVPGFMKAASSFLFSAISAHPQVLPPLRGSQLKETYCYHSMPLRKIMKRPWCFPYIEPGENFVSADGTVYYATDATMPFLLKADNPHAKAVFAVRHPADRFYSNYKFAYETYGKKGSIDALIEKGMAKDDKFGILRTMLLNGTSNEEMIEHYYGASFRDGGALAVLFMHSINFLAILHYRKVLGEENVMVVNSESLNTKKSGLVQATMSSVYEFLGLCPFTLPPKGPTLIGQNKMPLEKEMSQDGYRRLNKFFEPFHHALSRVTGWNLSHWDQRKAPNGLPKTTVSSGAALLFDEAKERPPAWFET